MLHIKNISKKFGSKIVLDNISCDIKKGTIAILLGGSGAGKSTLLRIIAGLEHHDTGSLVYNNHPLKNESVGMVFQHFNLFENLTVKDNIAFGLYAGRTHYDKKEADIRAIDLLNRYNLKDFQDNFPDELSGGQKQRLAILRTIAQKPDIICFDEPTSALDPLLKTYVAQTLIDLSDSGYTIIVATHDIHLVEQLTGSIMLMKSGSIIEKATPGEFACDSAKFPELKKYMCHN